jgi:hypothetical protein
MHSPYRPVTTSIPSGSTNCNLYTGTDIPPPPTSSDNISLIPSSSLNARDVDGIEARDPAKCTTTVSTTSTVTVKKICTTTQIASPPPSIISRTGTLTIKIPSFCGGSRGINTYSALPSGDIVGEDASGYPLSLQHIAHLYDSSTRHVALRQKSIIC